MFPPLRVVLSIFPPDGPGLPPIPVVSSFTSTSLEARTLPTANTPLLVERNYRFARYEMAPDVFSLKFPVPIP